MKYQYTCYDYSKILNIPKITLKLDKDYIIENATFDKETNAIVLNIRSVNGVEVVTIDTSNLIEENEQTEVSIRVV